MFSKKVNMLIIGGVFILIGLILTAILVPILLKNDKGLVIMVIPELDNDVLSIISKLNTTFDTFITENKIGIIKDKEENLSKVALSRKNNISNFTNYLQTLLNDNGNLMYISEDNYNGDKSQKFLLSNNLHDFPQIKPSLMLTAGIDNLRSKVYSYSNYTTHYHTRVNNLDTVLEKYEYPLGVIIDDYNFNYKIDSSESNSKYKNILEHFQSSKLNIFGKKKITIIDFKKSFDAIESLDALSFIKEIEFIFKLIFNFKNIKNEQLVLLPVPTKKILQTNSKFDLKTIENTFQSFEKIMSREDINCKLLADIYKVEKIDGCEDQEKWMLEYMHNIIKDTFGIYFSDRIKEYHSMSIFATGKKILKEFKLEYDNYEILGQMISDLIGLTKNVEYDFIKDQPNNDDDGDDDNEDGDDDNEDDDGDDDNEDGDDDNEDDDGDDDNEYDDGDDDNNEDEDDNNEDVDDDNEDEDGDDDNEDEDGAVPYGKGLTLCYLDDNMYSCDETHIRISEGDNIIYIYYFDDKGEIKDLSSNYNLKYKNHNNQLVTTYINDSISPIIGENVKYCIYDQDDKILKSDNGKFNCVKISYYNYINIDIRTANFNNNYINLVQQECQIHYSGSVDEKLIPVTFDGIPRSLYDGVQCYKSNNILRDSIVASASNFDIAGCDRIEYVNAANIVLDRIFVPYIGIRINDENNYQDGDIIYVEVENFCDMNIYITINDENCINNIYTITSDTPDIVKVKVLDQTDDSIYIDYEVVIRI